MATDAVVVKTTHHIGIFGMEMTPIVQLAPMQPGRSYLVWASGLIDIKNCLVTIELDAFHETDTIELAGPEFGTETDHPFSLAVGTTLPPDEDLFTVAKLSAAISVVLAEPTEVRVHTARLVVLAVDSVSVIPG